jgi:hypothetical protein
MSEGHPHQEHPHDDVHHAAPKPSAKKAQASIIRTMAMGLGISLCVALVAVVSVFVYGIYKKQWSGPGASMIAHALPLPAATVNGNVIRYADYLDDLATVRRFFAKQAEQANADGAPFDAPTDDELRSGVLERLVQAEILSEEVARFNIVADQKEVDDEYGKIAAAEGANPEEKIQELYGWSVAQFKEKVMKPYLLQTKLATAIENDEALNAPAKTRAEEALSKVKGGGDFAELAKEYSGDPSTAAEGGNLDWFERGIMVKEFEDVAFALKKGDVSDLVKTRFGYHIIRCDDIEKDKKTGEVTRVKASHILIPGTNVEEYLKSQTDKATIKKYVKE